MTEDALTGKLGKLTPESSNDEIKDASFAFAQSIGYMILSTSKNNVPAARGIEVHYLDNTNMLYIGMAPGKPMYQEIIDNPVVAMTAVELTAGRLSESVRLNAVLEAVDIETNPEIYARYWELNPGTKALYIKDLDRFRIFRLAKGNGRIFHMAGDDIVENLLFSWGDYPLSKWAYEIDKEKCIGCETCVPLCMEDVMKIGEDGKCEIDHFQCLECGRCFDVCPNDAVICTFK